MKRKELLKTLASVGALTALSCLSCAEAIPPAPSLTISKYALKRVCDILVYKEDNTAVAVTRDGEKVDEGVAHGDVLISSLANGKYVVLLDMFDIYKTVDLNSGNTLVGLGQHTGVKVHGDVLAFRAPSGASDIALLNFMIDCTQQTSGSAIILGNAERCRVIGLYIVEPYNHGIAVQYGKHNVVKENIIIKPARNGMGNGIYLTGTPDTSPLEKNIVANNIIVDSQFRGIYIEDAPYCVVEGNFVDTCAEVGINLGGNLIPDNLAFYVCKANIVKSAGTNGILVYKADYSIVEGNTIDGCGANGINVAANKCTIKGNIIRNVGSGYDGIRVNGYDNVIEGNVIVDDRASAVMAHGVNEIGGDYNLVLGNRIKGITSTAVNLTGLNSLNANNL